MISKSLTFIIVNLISVQISKKLSGIVREREKNDKFRNPSGFATVSAAFKGFEKPPYWRRGAAELDTDDETNNGYLNEAFIVWMRPAPFATFRKKYGKIRDGLAKGE